jgi:predicted ATP-dependent endonuclease of OLD family
MLTGIKFKNYKAFQDGYLEIKPITILLGANSVGKSSLIQLFLMLQETAIAENYKSALKLHGGFFSLGEGINLFRKKDNTNTLHFEIEFREPVINETIRHEYGDRFFEELISYCYFIFRNFSNEKDIKFFEDKFARDKNRRNGRDIGLLGSGKGNLSNMSSEDFNDLIERTSKILTGFKDKNLLKEVTSLHFFRDNLVGQSLLNNKGELLLTYEFLKQLQEIKHPDKVSLEYDFNYNEGILSIKKFKLNIGNVQIVNVDFGKVNDNKLFITSDLINFSNINNKYISELRKAFKSNKTVFSFVENYEPSEQNSSVICFYFINFISQIINKLEESFNTQRINYVSPLRAHPKRYYFLDKAKTNTFLDTLDGEAIAEILKEDSSLKNSVNSWFKKFNLHIDVGPIKDIIHQIVVKQNSLDLDITDVGFGVSQVLPVIIQGFLSKDKSITLVEQPEIHLHPKMQADLADLFIDISIKKNAKRAGFIANKYLIIETHS